MKRSFNRTNTENYKAIMDLAHTLRNVNPSSISSPTLTKEELQSILENIEPLMDYEARISITGLNSTYLKIKWYCDVYDIPFELPQGCRDHYSQYQKDVIKARCRANGPPDLSDLWYAAAQSIKHFKPQRPAKIAAAALLMIGLAECSSGLLTEQRPNTPAENYQPYNNPGR